MAKIPLRTYIKDIDSLIDQGLTEEAIAHCKHILKLFPKYLEAYGALGKAYLESQRYSEASDILERILSANPDDFVSQIGLSIIREDENNLDAAIFHMERAYEIQSSNTAIQEELKRLYGRRDGITPHKIRISRGALVRMYLRGELYPQTIAEARIALQDDPNRPDLEIALARAYFALGKDADATEICHRLIGKLPFCLDANQIMASITENTRSTDINTYRQKLIALDPYVEFCASSSTNSQTVSDDSILVDHLDWQPSMGMDQQPGWANIVGLPVESADEETAEWLNVLPSNDFSAPEPSIELAPPPQTEGNAFFDTLDLAASQEPNLDWLNEIADSKPDTNALPFINNLSESPSQDELPDWLRDTPLDSSPFIQPQEESSPLEQDSESVSEPDIPFSLKPEENLDWFGEFTNNQASEQNEMPSANKDDEALPDWLLRLKNETPTSEPSGQHESQSVWINQSESTTPEGPAPVDEEIPPFLITPQDNDELGIKPASDDLISPEPVAEELSEISEELPDWLKELQKMESPVTQGGSTLSNEPSIEAIVAELETAAPAIDEASILEKLETSLEEPEALMEEPETPTEELETSAEESVQSVNDLEPPVWINEFEPETPKSDVSEAIVSESSTEDVDAAMAWLESLAVQQGVDPETLITSPDERSQTPPDWVLQLKPEDAAESEPAITDLLPEISGENNLSEEPVETAAPSILFEEISAVSPIQEQEEKPDLDDLESWLRSLDAADEIAEETPDVVVESEESESPAMIEPTALEQPLVEIEPETPEPDSTPEWLKQAEEELSINTLISDEQELSDSEQINAAEMPEMSSPLEELESQSPASETSLPESTAESTLPAWLLELEQEESAAVETEPKLEAEPQPEFEAVSAQPEFTQAEPIVESQPLKTTSDLPNDLPQLLEIYRQKIDRNEALESIIDELITTSYRFPVEPSIWETLGDAYLQSGQIQKALDAYSKAEELLR